LNLYGKPPMLMTQSDKQSQRRARMIAEGIKDVAAELRLIDLADFVSFIRLGKFANIQDIVNSSVELYFKHGTLSYACLADFQLEWDCSAAVSLGMEFCHNEVTASFDLTLRAKDACVELHSLTFGEDVDGADMETKQLTAAIADARLASSTR
jgi:hypothetical protein